jgi:hypothetical protein
MKDAKISVFSLTSLFFQFVEFLSVCESFFKFYTFQLFTSSSWILLVLSTAQFGIVQLGVLILLYLSGEREFSIALNRPFTKKPLIDIVRFTGNYADFLILVNFQSL